MVSQSSFQRGAVSIFMVIFSMLVITIVTVGFLRLMTTDHRQASDSDLAQSAYDSALAGVEDAKRALIKYHKACAAGSLDCKVGSFSSTQSCNGALKDMGVITTPNNAEVPIQSTAGAANDAKLDQAYTCVKITPDTPDYRGSLAADESIVIPLRSVDTASFHTIKISWFNSKDLPAGTTTLGTLPSSLPIAVNRGLSPRGSWPADRPSVLRTQFMQTGSNGFTLSEFDTETSSGQSNANTVFLYPTDAGSSNENIADTDGRRAGSSLYATPASDASAPLASSCSNSRLTAGGYACEMTLRLPSPVGGGDRTAFLRLVPFFKATHFKVELRNDAGVVLFGGVQPSIDSTGRANDLFRRVEARVDLDSVRFPFPEAAVDVSGNFCKDFTVTPDAYIAGECTP